ncbi:hypothetical protein [Streptomyces sp. RKAG290]|uniref:hypothetical protein n=1 Tax=Streptomyces sp. RKAG290 TaxID=2888348 RepID=UPI002033BBC9|nr:hypothetical protein [Streptomyces sp. RKAG290]MCM2416307.1 hypothetical protein [Streptomyces sp. RKAG290]
MKRACPDPSPEDAAQPSPEEERSHLDHWRATLAGANPYPIARPSQPTDAADTAARDRLADLGATGRGLHRLARETGIPVRALLMAAHVRVLGSLTSHPEVVTAVGRAACGVKAGGLAPMRIRSADLSWLDLARAVLELEREAVGHTVPYRHIMDVAPGLLVDSRLCVTEIGPEAIAEGRAGTGATSSRPTQSTPPCPRTTSRPTRTASRCPWTSPSTPAPTRSWWTWPATDGRCIPRSWPGWRTTTRAR